MYQKQSHFVVLKRRDRFPPVAQNNPPSCNGVPKRGWSKVRGFPKCSLRNPKPLNYPPALYLPPRLGTPYTLRADRSRTLDRFFACTPTGSPKWQFLLSSYGAAIFLCAGCASEPLEGHRVPPQLLALVAPNAGSARRTAGGRPATAVALLQCLQRQVPWLWPEGHGVDTFSTKPP